MVIRALSYAPTVPSTIVIQPYVAFFAVKSVLIKLLQYGGKASEFRKLLTYCKTPSADDLLKTAISLFHLEATKAWYSKSTGVTNHHIGAPSSYSKLSRITHRQNRKLDERSLTGHLLVARSGNQFLRDTFA